MKNLIGKVCVGSTGRLGIVTHQEQYFDKENLSLGQRWAGFGLDGKGIWTSRNPIVIGDGKDFYYICKKRFNGHITYYG